MRKRSNKSPSTTPTSTPDASSTFSPASTEHKKVEYEFGGPIGALLTMTFLPLILLFLHLSATKSYKFTFFNADKLPQQFPKHISFYWKNEAFAVILAWFALNVCMERFLFAEKVKGVVLRNGSQLVYNISGHLQLWLILLFLVTGKPVFNSKNQVVAFTHYDLSYVYDNYIPLAMATVAFACLFSVFLYVKSFAKNALLASGGNTGNMIYDFFIGRELNPRIGTLDLKEFCELRPGLIGWVVLNLGCAMKQQQLQGYVSYEMILICMFQGVYVWDGLYHEKAILTTMDITSDGFGWMLCFGDLAWVPFSYSLQARYLVENPQNFGPTYLVCLLALNLLGYMIFRGSNSEKDAFRRDDTSDEVKHLKYLTTATGRKLMVSGWWGLARKINYTGDWLMGLSWCLTTGFSTPVTYFYSIYFFILLVHRAYRDDHACSHKYGKDWIAYKEKVPYVFIPGLI